MVYKLSNFLKAIVHLNLQETAFHNRFIFTVISVSTAKKFND